MLSLLKHDGRSPSNSTMKKITLTALLFAALAAVAGCETDAGLPEPPHTPRVALFHILTPALQDSSFTELFQQRQLYVSNSQRVFATSYLDGRRDATAELRDASGRVVERYRPVSEKYSGAPGYYRPVLGFRPQPGQPYTLRTSLPGLETAESTLTLPAVPTIESAAFQARGATTPNPSVQTGRLTVTIRDDANAANYYLVFGRILDAQGRPFRYGSLQADEDQDNAVGLEQFQLSSPVQQYNLGVNSIRPFADTNHNGEPLTLTANVSYNTGCFSQGPCPQPAFIEVTVSSLTADTYNFYLSNRRYYDADGNPFAEPAPLAGNVRNGYGLFGGATDATYRIRL